MTMTMRAEAALDQSPLGHELPPAVSATEVPAATAATTRPSTRCSVSIDGASRSSFTAVMGPSGSGKSTLMHISPGSINPPRAR